MHIPNGLLTYLDFANPDYAALDISWPALAVALVGMGGAIMSFVTAYTASRTAPVKVRKH